MAAVTARPSISLWRPEVQCPGRSFDTVFWTVEAAASTVCDAAAAVLSTVSDTTVEAAVDAVCETTWVALVVVASTVDAAVVVAVCATVGFGFGAGSAGAAA
jgi:hypothetical protein